MQTDHWLISQRFTVTFNIIFHLMTANSTYGSSSEFGVGRICVPDKHLLIFLNSAKTSPIVLLSCCTLLPGPPLCPSHHTTWDPSLCPGDPFIRALRHFSNLPFCLCPANFKAFETQQCDAWLTRCGRAAHTGQALHHTQSRHTY